MKKIKFRGKTKANNEWIYGGYVKDEHNNAHMIFTNELGAYNAGFKPKREDFVLNYYEVDPETVGQYTGLKDKNGKEIYEGDILNVICRFDRANMVVSYEDCKFVLKTNDEIGYKYLGDMMNIEVIGNIHDNPEL